MSGQNSKKTINYRDGFVRFDIPDHWVEEYEASGGGTFYELGGDTGTLRLSVLSFKTDIDVAADNPLTVFQKRSTACTARLRNFPAIVSC